MGWKNSRALCFPKVLILFRFLWESTGVKAILTLMPRHHAFSLALPTKLSGGYTVCDTEQTAEAAMRTQLSAIKPDMKEIVKL